MANNNKRKDTYLYNGAIAAVWAITSLFYWFGLFDSIQEKLTDRLFLRQPARADIVIVAVDDPSISEIGQWPWPRAVFGDLVGKLQNSASIAFDIHFAEKSRLDSADDLKLAEAFRASSPTIVLPMQRERGVTTAEPLKQFQEASQLGFINTLSDSDGVVRFARTTENSIPSFAGAATKATVIENRIFRIDYAGPQKTFLTFSAIDVLNDKVPARIFENSIIFVGATAESLHDVVQTPFGEMPGVEFHANVANALLNQSNFKETSKPLGVLMLAIVALLTGALVYYFKRLSFLIPTLAGFFALILLIVFAAFSYHVVLPGFYIVLCFILVLAAGIIYQYITESKEKRIIRDAFKFYLAPSVMDELMQNPDKLRLGGERKTVTIFFSDIRGFTTISEKLTPEELTHTINEYLSAMTDIVMENRGLVDKYIGDAIMAFWGAPVSNPEHAVDACRSVIKMSRKIVELNKHFTDTGRMPIAFGAGLNTGDVVVGNMGSSKRFNYTIMGDEVNFGSRLEGLTKAYGVMCLVSEATVIEVRMQTNTNDLRFRELDVVTVKGKSEPKKIFELIIDEMTSDFEKVLSIFQEGKKAYQHGNWQIAVEKFNEALAIKSTDGPSKVLLERSSYLKDHQPEKWDGVYEFKTK